ncbi:MAG: carboxymuconolactone decarboxylase family protein [Firmicutes bacterium]|nr:carboxymuconolactone decarboxylase family protein [Bacillota bacterium]
MEQSTRTLVEIAAAVAGGCMACLEQHLKDAREIGVSEADITEAISVAEATRRSAHATVLAAVEKARGLKIVSASSEAGCGCGTGCC